MSASTVTNSPTDRLTGKRPASTSGITPSMTTRRRPPEASGEGATAAAGAGVVALTEELIGIGVHRDDPETARLEPVRHRPTGLARVARRAHHGDGLRALEDLLRAARHLDGKRIGRRIIPGWRGVAPGPAPA